MPEFSGDGELIPGSECPKCSDFLEYNGNYWCSNPTCTWVLEESVVSKKDQDAFELAYILLMKQRDELDKINYNVFLVTGKEAA